MRSRPYQAVPHACRIGGSTTLGDQIANDIIAAEEPVAAVSVAFRGVVLDLRALVSTLAAGESPARPTNLSPR